jgi:hypothetical protein
MTMQTRTELMNIAAMTSSDVVGVMCTFELPRGSRDPKTYLYKCPRELALTLSPGDLVLVEYEGTQDSNRDRPVTTTLVKEVLDFFDPDDLGVHYRWLFGKINIDYMTHLQKWENDTTDLLVRARRRRTREAVMAEILGTAVERPVLPAPPKA